MMATIEQGEQQRGPLMFNLDTDKLYLSERIRPAEDRCFVLHGAAGVVLCYGGEQLFH